MKDNTVKFKKLHDKAVLPSYSTPGDAALDVTAVSASFNNKHAYWEYKTGIAVELPEDHVGLLFCRSSISTNSSFILSNAVGVIDQNFRGEITFRFKHLDSKPLTPYSPGDRIGQLLIIKYDQWQPVWVDDLSETVRGSGGYGHTGR